MNCLAILLAIFLTGCTSSRPAGSDVVFVVVGAGGSGGYGGLCRALSSQGRSVLVFSWGAPPPLFFLNFSNRTIHDEAERKLAQKIEHWRRAHPASQIDLVAHSAGCGVTLGALQRVNKGCVRNVVLLGASVSPDYDLHPALARIDGVMHAFCSDRDVTFLDWRTSHFGTYDGKKTRAAGHMGFVGDYPQDRFKQYLYDPSWRELGNDGGHWASLSEPFVRTIIAPLLKP